MELGFFFFHFFLILFLQERINRDSVNILALYFQKFRGVAELRLGEEEEEELGELFAELMNTVKMSRRFETNSRT